VRAKVITDVTEEPVTLAEAYLQIGVEEYGSEGRPDDALIEAMIGEAREYCENFCGLSFGIKTLEVALDSFPDDGEAIELPMGPAIEIIAFDYGGGSDGSLVEGEDYVRDDYASPTELRPISGAWPNATEEPNYVRIRYRAGYGVDSDAQTVPRAARAAIRLMLAHLYDNREAVNVGNIVTEFPLGVESLLRPLRVRLGMA
jgi:uncharacterized phiE125 gp8 family phage protein